MNLLSNPRLYDWIQIIAGVERTRLRLKRHFDTFTPGTYVLDFGGGTGSIAPSLPRNVQYFCLDIDAAKLAHLRSIAVVGDVTDAPIRSNSVDVVLSIAVSHHLSDEALDLMFSETRRILKNGGRLVFLDPLAGSRIAARLLWSIDRGAHPRSADALHIALNRHLTVVHQERHTIWHDYLTMIATKDGDS